MPAGYIKAFELSKKTLKIAAFAAFKVIFEQKRKMTGILSTKKQGGRVYR
jgi:hypothetical protein